MPVGSQGVVVVVGGGGGVKSVGVEADKIGRL